MTLNIDVFLWNHNEAENHDKYWGYVFIGETYYNFWGKRGKKPTLKRYTLNQKNKLMKLHEEKLKKGYKDFTNKIERFFPNFTKSFEIDLTIARLGDNFHAENVE